MSDIYQKSGVSLEAGYEAIGRIKKHVNKTHLPGVLGSIGSFGGMFDLSLLGYKEPVLVSGTDGVGTKLMIAISLDKHDTIGEDLVAMCVNDVIAQGAKPLFFLDYIATGKNYPQKIEQIVSGVANGCVKAGCALIGGETAEMPDMYKDSHYDLAGFAVGIAEKNKLISGEKVQVDDVVIGLTSSGIHSNGYSLVRKIILKDSHLDLDEYNDRLQDTLGEVLLTPTKIYTKPVLNLLNSINIHGMAHITGGGFDENIPRALKKGQGVQINLSSYAIPEIFKILQELGNIPNHEMYNIFNMGIGFVVIVSKTDVSKTLEVLRQNGEEAIILGKIIEGNGVEYI